MNTLLRVRQLCLLTSLCFFLLIQPANSQDSKILQWNDGIRVSNRAGTYKAKFGGRVMIDIARFNQRAPMEDQFGKVENGYEIRRLRVFHSGKYKNIKYKVSVEFSKWIVLVQDLYVEIGKVPVVGNVRVGHFKEPFLLEMHSSSKTVVFMERALTTMFSSGRNLGVMIHNGIPNSKLTWEVGTFRTGFFDAFGKTINTGYNIIGRFSGIVAQNESGSRFVHLGVGLKQSKLDIPSFKLSSRPESHLALRYISSGTLEDIKGTTEAQAEIVLQSGRLSVQGEMVHTFAYLEGEHRSSSAYYFPAFYGQVSYMLTGEARNYKGSRKGFGKVKPKKSLFKGGLGAWEIAARYSRANLNSKDVSGGILNNTTLGLNWYPNTITRISANYIFANVAELGNSNIFQMRFQVAI
jgi:phosphate-selective porin OprO and OprP